MSKIGIADAFGKYGAALRNVQWSVSAWAPDGSLVVSLWAHHYRRGPGKSAEYSGSVTRWSGPGNNEFRTNVAKAYKEKSRVRLVIVNTEDTHHVDSGADASKVKKSFHVREDLVGHVIEYDGDKYTFRFTATGRP
jgi:hypothetical protein